RNSYGPSSLRQSGTSSFLGFDLQSSVRILVSVGGIVTDRYTYKAFGEELEISGITRNPLRYQGMTGYYRDTTERLYVKARHLNTLLGRWISRDPIGFKGGTSNLYEYVANNPVTLNDPSGLKVKCKVKHFSSKWLGGPQIIGL